TADLAWGRAGRRGGARQRRHQPGRHDRGWRSPQDLRAGGLADRHRRRVHVPRQRARGGRRGARAPLGAGVRPRALHRAHGPRGVVHRPPAPEPPLDRLCGPGRDPLCRRRDDLSRLQRGLPLRRGL
ncbi:MAG: Integral membrane protein TerC family, partial [uncultured Thermoleophilia bacterium]